VTFEVILYSKYVGIRITGVMYQFLLVFDGVFCTEFNNGV
jgi:hypothetical protein